MSAVAASQGSLARGLVYKDKWKVLHPLTETDRSYVFLGSPVDGGKPVAIKVLKERRAKDSRFMKHHHADMQAAMALPVHPGLVPVLDASWTNGRYVVVSRFVPGVSLASRLKQPRPIPYETVLATTRQIVALLSFANDAGIRFRSVELEHLVLEEESRQIRLLRFSMPRSARLGIEPPTGAGPDLQLAGSLLHRMFLGTSPQRSGPSPGAEIMADSLRDRVASVYPEVSPEELHDLSTLFVRSGTLDPRNRLDSYREFDTRLATLEGQYRPLQEERRQREREERRERLFGTAYDTVLALRGSGPAEPGEEDLREQRIQRTLLIASVLMLLTLAWSLLSG